MLFFTLHEVIRGIPASTYVSHCHVPLEHLPFFLFTLFACSLLFMLFTWSSLSTMALERFLFACQVF